MATNTEIEECWIDAWNELYDIIGEKQQVNCLLPDGSVVDLEACQGWLQESAYQGYRLKVETGWVLGRYGVWVSRFKESSREEI
jgi:hypothetical protein